LAIQDCDQFARHFLGFRAAATMESTSTIEEFRKRALPITYGRLMRMVGLVDE
jgi:hypothetical protein